MNISPQKFIFGTANLLTTYGQKSSYLDANTSFKLLNTAYKKKIKILDISSDYKIFKKRFQRSFLNKWQISFKISSNVIKLLNSKEKISKYMNSVFNKFKCTRLDYILFHHENDLLKKNGKLFFDYLIQLKKRKIIKKIGVSLYNFDNTFKIIRDIPIDVIQVPFNILDQRLLEKKNLRFIKKNKIEVHVRSIFLQGLLVDRKIVPQKFLRDKKFKMWFDYIEKKNKNPLNEIFLFLKKINLSKK